MTRRIIPIIVVMASLFCTLLWSVPTHASNVKIQVCMVVDGSGSISSAEWNLIKQATSQAINNTIPHDGSVELTIVQFGYPSGSGYAKTEIAPTVILSANYAVVAGQVLAMSKGGGGTPTAHGLYLGWKELRNSLNYAFQTRQVINLATDEDPSTRNNNATSDLDQSGGSPTARDDVIAVVNSAVTQGLDELDVEGIALSNSTRDWFRNWVVRPQPGILAPPITKPGWIRPVANVTEFANTIGQKLESILTNVRIQLCMVLDGSGSMSSTEWNVTRNGIANAIRDSVPHDGSVELSIVQFGVTGNARVEISPTIVSSANYGTIAANVAAIVQGKGGTPMAHGLYLGWNSIESSVNFQTAVRHTINLATDGVTTTRNNNATSDLDGDGHVNQYDDVIAVVNNAVSHGLDELDVEGIGITDTARDWMKNWTARPQPGHLAPPFAPGWIRVVANASQFADTVGQKFQAVLVDNTPPSITDVHQQPTADNVLPTEEVQVYANVTDDLSGVKQVILSYTTGNGTWFNVTMSNLMEYQYNGTIPQFSNGTRITYMLIAEDNANNTITTQQMGYDYQYQVVQELPPLLTAPILVATTLFTVISVRKRKLRMKSSLRRQLPRKLTPQSNILERDGSPNYRKSITLT